MVGHPYSRPAVCFYLVSFACGWHLWGDGEGKYICTSMKVFPIRVLVIDNSAVSLFEKGNCLDPVGGLYNSLQFSEPPSRLGEAM